MSFFGKKLSEKQIDDEARKVLLQLAPRRKILSPREIRKANRQEKFESMVDALAKESKGAVAGESDSESEEEEGAFQEIPKTAKQLREEAAEKRVADRKEAKAKRAAEKEAQAAKRDDERVKRKAETQAETQALTAALFQPYYDLNFDIENMDMENETEEEEEAEPYDVDDILAEMTPEERAVYEEEERMKKIVKEIEREQIDILNESREEDLARKNQDISEGKDSGFKRSEVEKNRQRLAKSANAKPFFERMEGDDDKFGGKKRTMRRKNKKGTRMAMARRTRQRKTRTRTRTMRKKARKSKSRKSRKSRK